MIESINDGVVTDEETIMRYLHTTQTEIENLGQLVNNLFELSQIAAGLLELHTEPVSLQELILETVEVMTAQATSSKLKLEGEVDQEMAPVIVDSRRVQRVLYNLVQNAIRHTPPDGSIHIRARDVGETVVVQVEDTGEGIPANDLDKIFERSYRSDQSRSRQSGGAGLGLSIAKGIIEAHGERIWVESVPGRGSIFSFTLPKVPTTQD
jgi:signal transduction histidine kinase